MRVYTVASSPLIYPMYPRRRTGLLVLTNCDMYDKWSGNWPHFEPASVGGASWGNWMGDGVYKVLTGMWAQCRIFSGSGLDHWMLGA